MFTIVLWWGVIGWCVAMVSIGFLIDCHMRSKVGTPSASDNNARDEICTDIISNCICDYCVHKPGMASDYCGDCSGGSEFVGRKLRPC